MAPRRTKAQLEAELKAVTKAAADAARSHRRRVTELESRIADLESDLESNSGRTERRVREAIGRLKLDGAMDLPRAAAAIHLAEVLDSIDERSAEVRSLAGITKQLDALLEELTPESTGPDPLAGLFGMEEEGAAQPAK